MKAIRKKDGLVFDLSEFVYDTDGNEYQWDEVTLIPSDWDERDLNHLRQYTASLMMANIVNGMMQSTLLMEQYHGRAVREGYKTIGAMIAADAVGYADALIDEFVKQGKRMEP
jgi:hypothetical protein